MLADRADGDDAKGPEVFEECCPTCLVMLTAPPR